jgi:hypothetical protein
MVPPPQRSIRNIPVSGARRRREPEMTPVRDADADDIETSMDQERPPMIRRRAPRQPRRMFLIIAGVVVVVCALAGLLLSTLFAGATVTIVPKEEQVAPPSSLTAKANGGGNELTYETMTVTRSASTTVAASGTKQVSRSASGSMVISNAASTEPQRLIANTRFEAPDGKIYRIHDSVVVPGGTKGPGGDITPGTVTATVYADSPGAEYNRGATRFTIPGFKSDPRYDKFYADAQAIEGGFVGQEPAVASADLAKASDALKQGLSQVAQSSLTSQVPANYIVVPGSLQVSFSDVSQTAAGEGSAIIAQTATMVAAIIDTGRLASAIAQASVQGYNGEPVQFKDPSQLVLAAATTTKSGADMPITLGGSPTLIWQFDPAAVKTALLGKPKADFQKVIESFGSSIARAEAKVRPFWQSTFPADAGKITVTTAEK